jgi:hypothetical protein
LVALEEDNLPVTVPTPTKSLAAALHNLQH